MDHGRQDDIATRQLLDTESIRRFVVVAEELHFGRAAARLLIAQPALSKTIQGIEARLGVPLFIRTSRNVALTPAGEALLEHGRHALNAVAVAAENARSAAGQDHLRLVIKPGGEANLLSGILAAYAILPGAVPVDILFSGSTDRTDFLHGGRADVGLLYVPFDDLTGLAGETLQVEDRVAVLSDTHPLAGREYVRTDDLARQTFPHWRGVDDGADGPEVADLAELIPLVRIGRVIAVLPRSLITPAPPGTVCVEVADAEPSHLVIARRQHDRRAAVTAFIAAAVASARARHPETAVSPEEQPALTARHSSRA
jgi:DNA-binding transcriptional LysR family regulator